MRRSKTVAVTGGIGSGKSFLGQILRQKGYTVIDADTISRQVCEKGRPGYAAVVENFGDGILDGDGNLDRKKLASIVFSNESKLRLLNSILHPIIERELSRQLKEHEEDELVFVLIPLLFELGWQDRFDYVWLVLADEEVRIARTMARDGSGREEVQKRIKNQVNHAEKAHLAHNVLYNNSSEEFKVQVERALDSLRGR
jgi:dephospho-CoA kinase